MSAAQPWVEEEPLTGTENTLTKAITMIKGSISYLRGD